MMRKEISLRRERNSLHIGAFGKERKCLKEKDLDRICIFDAVEFVCPGGVAQRNERQEYLGTLSLDVLVVPYLDFRKMNADI